MLVYFFVISIVVEVFGGPTNITIETSTLEGCKSARRMIIVGMRDALGAPKPSTVITQCESRLKKP